MPHEIKPLIISKSLRQVVFLTTFCRRGNEYLGNTPDALPFLHLPNLQHISVGIDNRFAFLLPVEVPSLPNLVSLKLDGIREDSLPYILEPLENLQALNWRFYCNTTQFSREDFIDLEAMGAALRYISKTAI